MSIKPNGSEKLVAIFTFAYMAVFTAWFLLVGNYEFIVYVVTMLALVALIGLSLRKAEYPVSMLWCLSVWGLAHMAGGSVPVDGSVLYNLHLFPLIDTESVFILKYDQLVHAFGFGVTAWLLHHLMIRHFPDVRGTATELVYPALASIGLGAVNEIIEFSAVIMVPDTNVGGYFNTALDLCFNTLGAVIAVCLILLTRRANSLTS